MPRWSSRTTKALNLAWWTPCWSRERVSAPPAGERRPRRRFAGGGSSVLAPPADRASPLRGGADAVPIGPIRAAERAKTHAKVAPDLVREATLSLSRWEPRRTFQPVGPARTCSTHERALGVGGGVPAEAAVREDGTSADGSPWYRTAITPCGDCPQLYVPPAGRCEREKSPVTPQAATSRPGSGAVASRRVRWKRVVTRHGSTVPLSA